MNNTNQEKISTMITDMINRGTIHGASYSFFNESDSKNSYEGVAGAIDPYNKIKLEDNMYYDIASLTKVVGTTTRIMQFIESGKINLDTKVNSLLEKFKHKDITIENLLLHNSGLPADIAKTFTADDIYIKLYEAELIYNTNEKSIYSDLGFMLLGFIIEKIDNTTLNSSFRKNIFCKLSMEHTGYIIDKKNMYIPTELTETRGLIQAATHDSKAYVLGEAGSAGLFSSLDDLLLFAKSFINGSNKILLASTIDKLIATNICGRSYGWDKKYGDNVLYHSGFTGTSILINIKKKEGFILLTNRIHPSRDNNTFLETREILNNLFLM